jgi:DNA repair protein RadD
MTLTLRPYQQASIDALFAYWADQPGNPLIVLPTGAGKSLVMASIIRRLVEDWPDMRLACVTHVRELIAQNYSELCQAWPWAPAGIFSAGMGRRESQAQILFCGIQTVRGRAEEIGHVDVLFVDECHLIGRGAATGYATFIAGLRAINPDLRIVGLTATPYRLDSGRLDEPDPRAPDTPPLFDAVAYEVGIRQLIDEGYLCPLVSKATATVLDVTGVGKRGGEFIAGELQAAVNRTEVTAAAVDEIIRYGAAGRRSWLMFCSGVDHAYAVRDELRRRAVTAEAVTGDTPDGDRDRILADFKAGRIRAVTNNAVLTTGFNHPGVDLLAMLRPTMSTSLYVQIVGRGSRVAPGKRDCLVLDFAGNVARHGPVDDVRPRKPGAGGGDAPIKICPPDAGGCASIVAASCRVCPDCGHEFPVGEEARHAPTASDAPILAAARPEWVPVARRSHHTHQRALPEGGIRESVRVEFLCGLTVHRIWLSPELDGKPRRRFEAWWRDHGGGTPAPRTNLETRKRWGELSATEAVQIRPNGRLFEVVGYRPARRREVAA